MHGIGGRTIAEAKRRMTWVEAQRWVKYLDLRGSLNLGERIEQGFALIAWLLTQQGQAGHPMRRADGSQWQIGHFMPHADKQVAADKSDEELRTEAIEKSATLQIDDFLRVMKPKQGKR